jgi:Arc/MetJ family transcription regulator
MCITMYMRTNIVLNDELIQEAMRCSKAKTKRAVIEEALGVLVRVRTEEQRRATYRDRLKTLEQKTAGLTMRESSLTLLRHDREAR